MGEIVINSRHRYGIVFHEKRLTDSVARCTLLYENTRTKVNLVQNWLYKNDEITLTFVHMQSFILYALQ